MGPHAANGRAENVTTLLTGIRERAARAGIEVTFVPGCDTRCTNTDEFDAAADAARQTDLVIAVMGETQDLSGEAASRATLTLPGRQGELLDRLIGTGKPVVLALTAGRPLTLGPWLSRVRAAMMTWFLGTEGGPAFADILFGDAAPSGRLPLTWPRDVGQVPIHYDRLPTGRPFQSDNRFTLHYADADWTPQFPFGFGLTYTRFAISPPVVVRSALGPRDTLEARVTITNRGEREGATVAQLYVRKPVAALSRPLRELKAFQKVMLKPGESREATLRVPVRDLGYHDESGAYVVEAGDYELGIGEDATVPLTIRFRLTGGLRLSPKGSMLRN
jgi:beta-glucosidase